MLVALVVVTLVLAPLVGDAVELLVSLALYLTLELLAVELIVLLVVVALPSCSARRCCALPTCSARRC